MLYHPDTPVTDRAAHEHREFSPSGSATHERRHDPVDEQYSSRAKMWDPVKDCRDPTTQANVSGFSPVRHDSSRLDHSRASASTSTGLHLPHVNHPYGQSREGQQRLRGLHNDQAQDISLGYQGNASLPFPQSQTMAAVYPINGSMNPQPMQVGHPHDQLQHYYQHRPVYKDISTLHPRLRHPSGHIGSQSVTKGTALMGMQPRQVANLHDHARESRQQDIGMGSRMPTSVMSHESVHSPQSPSSMRANMPTQRISGFQRANYHQPQSFFPGMSQAMEMAQYAKRVDQRSNREEAIRAYEQACALFQDEIIRSSSFEERMELNVARNACQARLDVLSQEPAASPSNPPPEQDDQQDDQPDDDGGAVGGKPQYSLYEDWALCRKMQEGLSWQEVAETSIFKGRRKHRSLSQRKHTIGKMGPKYHEVEAPWTEADNRKLCALGDAGKSLGEIHRKFRSRNAERCLDRYFYLKGYHTTGSSHTRTSHQARHTPASRPHSPKSMQEPGCVARRQVYGFHPGASISEMGSHGQSIDAALQQTRQRPAASSQTIPSVSTLGSQTSEASYPSSNNAAFPRPPATRRHGPSDPRRQLERQGISYSTPSSSSSFSSSPDPGHRTVFMPPPLCYSSPFGALSDNVSSRAAPFEAHRNASAESPLASWHPRLSMSSSSLSATTANSPTNQTSPTSSLSTPRTMMSPFASRNSPDVHSVAARKVQKPG